MTKHPFDHRSPSNGSKLRHFLRLSQALRPVWHRLESTSSNARLVQFCRIARGQQA